MLARVVIRAVHAGRQFTNTQIYQFVDQFRIVRQPQTVLPDELQQQQRSPIDGSRYRTAWLVLATTGMRRGEVLGLRWCDIDFVGPRLSIRQTITLVDHEIRIALRTKTDNGRAVDLDAATVAELHAHRVRRAQELLLLGIRADRNTLVFCHPDGRPYNPDRFSREFDRALERNP
jgi:integrase